MQHYSDKQITDALTNNPNAAAIAREHGLTHKKVWSIARTAGIDLTAGRAAKEQGRGFAVALRKSIVAGRHMLL